MIVDNVSNLELYKSLNKNISAVANFIRSTELGALSPGKHPINGDDCFLLLFEYETKAAHDAIWEAHRKFLDLHITIKGKETFHHQFISNAQSSVPYNAEKDAEFFTAEGSFRVLANGTFALFYPHDVHVTGVHVEAGPQQVKKAVFKLKI